MAINRIVPPPPIPDSTRWWNREDLVLIVLLAALFYLPGLGSTCLFDRDEPRFSEAAREMLRSGDYIVPHFNGDLRPDKPPLLYWLMSLSYRLVGVNELGARLPSAVCGTLTLLAVYFIAGFRFGRVTGLVAALLLASCTLFIAESRLATADATMILFTTVALGCAWRAWEAPRPGLAADHRIVPKAQQLANVSREDILDHGSVPPERRPMAWWTPRLFWVALAAGTLTKGVPLLFVLLPMIALSIATGAWRDPWQRWRTLGLLEKIYHAPALVAHCVRRGNWGWWRHLRPATGFPMLIALVGWWVLAAGIQTDWEIFKQMIGHHVLARSREGLEGHHYWPGFYLCMVWATFWPWSMLLLPLAYFTVRRLLERTALAFDPQPYQFLVAWIVPSWIVYEFIQTRLVHYVLPLYPALIILCAAMLVQSWNRLTDVLAARWFKTAVWFWLAVWTGTAAAILVYFWLFLPPYFWRAVPLATAWLAVGVGGALAWNRPAWPFVTVLAFASALMLGHTVLIPEIQELRVSRLAAAVLADYARHGYAIGACGYEEPSLVFYVGAELDKDPAQGRTLELNRQCLATLQMLDMFARLGHPQKLALVVDEATFAALGPRGAAMEVASFRAMPAVRLHPVKNALPHVIHVISNQPLPLKPPLPPATQS